MSYRLIAEIGVLLGVVVAYELYTIVGKLDEILQRMEDAKTGGAPIDRGDQRS